MRAVLVRPLAPSVPGGTTWRWRLVGLFLFGLSLRILVLGWQGTGDMVDYIAWGERVLHLGLARGTIGLPYFPVENQLLGLAAWISQTAHISGRAGIRLVNLAFDTGIFLVLLRLLRLWRVQPAFALVYWLHPYVLLTFSLGYIDFHQAFFAILAVFVAERLRAPVGYLLAGGALGLAILMKGQALVLIIMVVTFLVVRIATRRDVRDVIKGPLLLLVLPLAEFAAYSFYFHARGFRWLYLAGIYINIQHAPYVGQSLTAHMLNIWYPVAYYLRHGQGEIWQVVGPEVLHTVANVLTGGLLVGAALLIARRYRWTSRFSVLFYLSVCGTLILPMTLTRMHENYFYIGAVFAICVLAVFRDQWFRYGMHVFLALQAINLLGLYGLGESHVLASWPPLASPRDWYTYPVRELAAFVSIGAFVVAAFRLIPWVGNGTRDGRD